MPIDEPRTSEDGAALHDDLESFRQRMAAASESLMITDRDGVIRHVNRAFERLTGYTGSEALGQPAHLISSGLHPESFYAELWNTVLAGREFRALFTNRRKDGEIFHEEKTIRPFVDSDGEPAFLVGVGRPVNDFVHDALARLERLANIDGLTGLPGRTLFLDRLAQHCARAVRHGKAFAVAFLDLDNFKSINDRFGHAAGDLALCATARRLQEGVRKEDTVARLGGDEFGIILCDIHERDAIAQILDKIISRLATGILIDTTAVPIHSSVGVSIFAADEVADSRGDELLRRADHAMYAAKAAGGGLRFAHPRNTVAPLATPLSTPLPGAPCATVMAIAVPLAPANDPVLSDSAPAPATALATDTSTTPPLRGEDTHEAMAQPSSSQRWCPPPPAGPVPPANNAEDADTARTAHSPLTTKTAPPAYAAPPPDTRSEHEAHASSGSGE
ncbi:diguanylate cyclase [Rhodocyclus tenuis]|uniref:Diguanylate cyclase n=1 Tax=Rhodocyclus gracilis TaxID=2929842 RepID=A0ABX0WH19_9RHOO|nr:diguanylate cyclase [Rhodocyclus gracilis]